MPTTATSVQDLLAQLTGSTVFTISQRKPNRILGLEDGEAVVETEHGTDRVPVSQLEAALEGLRRDGEVRLTPEAFPEFASRSSFVGAVLAELEDVEVLTNPQRARMRQRATLGSLLERACSEVALPRASQRYSAEDPFAVLMTSELRDAVDALVPRDGSWKVKGSAGQGNWAGTPWVAVFDLNVTDTATRGYYVVYLVRADGTGVVLSLCQGTTDVYRQVRTRYRAVLEQRAASYAELIADDDLDGLQTGRIDLGGGRPPLTPAYESGSVVAIRYEAGGIPGETQLASDLHRMLDLYRALIEARDGIAEGDAGSGETYEERRRLRWHQRAEGRNRRAVREAKRLLGYRCCVCGVDFEAEYGELGRRCIDAHHLTPFGELGDRPRNLDPRRDFAIVCGNHHRMLHATDPPLTPEELIRQLSQGVVG